MKKALVCGAGGFIGSVGCDIIDKQIVGIRRNERCL